MVSALRARSLTCVGAALLQDICAISWSPKETYIVTYSDPDKAEARLLTVWDARWGEKVRTIPLERRILHTKETELERHTAPLKTQFVPELRWAADDRFAAQMVSNAIRVYEMPGMHLANKTAVAAPNMRDIAWSPTDNYLAYARARAALAERCATRRCVRSAPHTAAVPAVQLLAGGGGQRAGTRDNRPFPGRQGCWVEELV